MMSVNTFCSLLFDNMTSVAGNECQSNEWKDTVQLDCIERHAINVLQKLDKLRQSVPKTCDLVLVADTDGTEVLADRKVMAACSEYFYVRFYGTMSSMSESQSQIRLYDISGENLRRLVDYCYTGILHLSEDSVQELLAVASFLLMESVVDVCSVFLINNLCPSNCIGIYLLARRLNCLQLIQHSEKYILLHFNKIFECTEFLDLDMEHLMRLLRSNRLTVPNEERVFESCKIWLDNNNEKKEDFSLMKELLPVLNFSLLSPSFIEKHIRPLVKPDDLLMICELAKQRTINIQRNWSETTLLTVGGHYRVDANNRRIGRTIKRYDAINDSWPDWFEIPDERYWFGLVVLHDNLIVIGGYNDAVELDSVYNLNLTRMEWTKLPSLQDRRASLCVAVLGGTVYAIGGCPSRIADHHTVECWTPGSEQWKYVRSMSTPRGFAGAAVFNNHIYVIGGGREHSVLRSVECYSPATDRWINVAPMNYRRRDFGIAVSRDYIYVAGGLPINNTVERYDPLANEWIMLCSMGCGRCGFTCAFVNRRLLAIGGYSDASMNEVEQYNVEENSWTNLNVLDAHISSPVAIHIPSVFIEVYKWLKS